MPQMTESAYTKVRDAFIRAIPARVTTTWVMTNIEGYSAQLSARNLVASLRRFGLVDEDGAPTELAARWRLDDTYAATCEVLLRNAYPHDLVEAVSAGLPKNDVLVSLFMSHGFGQGSAKNLSRIFRLIASKDVPLRATNALSANKKTQTSPKAQAERPRLKLKLPEPPGPGPATEYERPEATVTVLRYFLDRGRLAEVRVPADLDAREKKRLFAHLRIDLLDEVDPQ